jgi:uncharacterized hydrophobic protein (TIGR00271 family)
MAESKDVSEAVEEAASEKLGIRDWDRPAIYRETAEAATENRLPYWSVLMLSGAIATLGLAVNSSAVVIGAMLVAPLLAPVVGLALGLATGDGRLSLQTALVVLGSTFAVIAAGAALTVLLPFHTITLEISARTRPTTLDLAIAVLSGFVGAVVTVARKSRLSAAIPGVAISVALIPPLAVAGFGMGIGRADLIRGSLLLYGANLAGIVLSGMSVFLLIGMHRPEVLDTARRWHRESRPHGVTAWADRVGLIRSVGVFQSPWSRVGLVLSFAVALGLPLSETLSQIARETRVERAVAGAEQALFNVPGRASVIGREVEIGAHETRVYLRIATTAWFGGDAREEFERTASAAAGEPVRLTLEQLPTRGDDLEQLRNLLPGQERAAAPAPPAALSDLLASVGARLTQAMETVALPASVLLLQTELAATAAGGVRVGVDYAAPEPLDAQAEEMLKLQVQRTLDLPAMELRLRHVSLADRVLPAATDTAALRELSDLLRSYSALWLEILSPDDPGSGPAGEVRERLREAGVPADRVAVSRAMDAGGQTRLRLHVREPAT